MEITIFSKKRRTADGKTFHNFIARLNRKDGTKQVVAVKFDDKCDKTPKPEQCPMNIIFDKPSGHIQTKDYVREDSGETGKRYILWLSAWREGSPWVDNSLDEFDL